MSTGKSITLGTLAVAALTLAGCRQDMHNQPKFYPQRGSDFYADGRSVRPQVANTVARGQLHEDAYFYTGMQGAQEGNAMPFPVTRTVLARGQETYNVFCTPCHSRVGNGAGMIVQRGYAKAGNFHTVRLQNAPLGHFFNVITYGYGAMPNYASQMTPEERWAVVAYIKALQLSQNATQADVPGGEHVEPLTELTRRAGFDNEHFASEWTLPPTAVSGTKDGEPYVLPPSAQGNAGGGNGQFPAQGAMGDSAHTPSQGLTGPAVMPHGQGSNGYAVPGPVSGVYPNANYAKPE